MKYLFVLSLSFGLLSSPAQALDKGFSIECICSTTSASCRDFNLKYVRQVNRQQQNRSTLTTTNYVEITSEFFGSVKGKAQHQYASECLSSRCNSLDGTTYHKDNQSLIKFVSQGSGYMISIDIPMTVSSAQHFSLIGYTSGNLTQDFQMKFELQAIAYLHGRNYFMYGNSGLANCSVK